MSSSAKLQQVTALLDQLVNDTTIPKNIRKSIQEIKEMLLNDKSSLDIRAATANSRLDEIANDPNIPPHARTTIWSVISQLETIK